MICIEVAVVAPVRKSYSYRLPAVSLGVDSDYPANLVGRRVFVPFGKTSARGFIIEASCSQDEADEIKEIFELIDATPLFHADIVPLFRWMAEYYHYPLGHVIATALPGGLRSKVQTVLGLTNDTSQEAILDTIHEQQHENWLTLLLEKKKLTPAETKRVLAVPENKVVVDRLIKAGHLVRLTDSGSDSISKKLEACYMLDSSLYQLLSGQQVASSPHITEEVTTWFCSRAKRSPGKAELRTILEIHELSVSRGQSEVPRRELLAAYPYCNRVLQSLQDTGIVVRFDRRVYRNPTGELLPYFAPVEKLTESQVKVLDSIGENIAMARYRTFLLHGVTGSGKTEVYLQATAKALEHGRHVLILVPEIALATQIEAHFVSRFGTEVALLHSGLSPGERYDEWGRIVSGTARVVVGARSAVFAPLANLGLIIVDEEHDSSFKQQDGLRYHARDVAIVRGQLKKATVILGSATPAITSFFNSINRKYELLHLPTRIGGRSLPEVKSVDIKQCKNSAEGLFHPLLRSLLEETLSQGKQSILLLNRRGFSTSVICLDCGTMAECRHCKVTLNLHKHARSLLCHYCGYRAPDSAPCRQCGSFRMHPIGSGTERISEELAAVLPEARVARVDSDTAADRKSFLSILQATHDHQIDVLVGTQMLAKGLHFPDVTLVGIVMADCGLGFPDYRAAERTYQLIAQVTGRAGRGDTAGRVVIQSLQPDHYAIKFAAEHRYNALVERELAIRKQVGFPPFSRLVFILVEDQQSEKARSRAEEICRAAQDWLQASSGGTGVSVLGPAPAAIERLRDRYRWQIMLKATDTSRLHQLTEHLALTFRRSGKERIIIDVDPDNML